MFFARLPEDARLRSILEGLSDSPFTHAHEGVTAHPIEAAPKGYRLDRYGEVIGRGGRVLEAARAALERFGNYPASFTRVVSLEDRVARGVVFGTVARHFGFASMHPCRVAFVIDDDAPDGSPRFGFGLGTLPGHIGSGEECFLLTMDPETEEVSYRVQAISRPKGFLGHLGAPVFRVFQARFRKGTLEAMHDAIR